MKIVDESGLPINHLGGTLFEACIMCCSFRLTTEKYEYINDEKTPIIVQGFTGDKASFHADEMIKYGSNVVGGVTLRKRGIEHLSRPVFNTVKDAVNSTGATASLAFVPPSYAADALMEAASVKTGMYYY